MIIRHVRDDKTCHAITRHVMSCDHIICHVITRHARDHKTCHVITRRVIAERAARARDPLESFVNPLQCFVDAL